MPPAPLPFDPRVTLVHQGRAAQALDGLLAADAYAAPDTLRCVAPLAAIRQAPRADAEQADQLLFGEAFAVLARQDGFALGQGARNGYVGWVDETALGVGGTLPTHRVGNVRAFAFETPDFKTPHATPLGLNALVTVDGREGRYLHVAGAGWVVETQLADWLEFETDPVTVAERLVGVPYLWSGRDSSGLDCSGLVQQALNACGLGCPRDSDQQVAELGEDLAADVPLRRGDLVGWDGHIGLMVDDRRLIHASTHAMAVAVEPLSDVIARQGPPITRRRL